MIFVFKEKEVLFREIHAPQTECGPSQKAREAVMIFFKQHFWNIIYIPSNSPVYSVQFRELYNQHQNLILEHFC